MKPPAPDPAKNRVLPTLTEVVAPAANPRPARPAPAQTPARTPSPMAAPAATAPLARPSATGPAGASPAVNPGAVKADAMAILGQRITMQVLLDMQRRTDGMLEQRVRQALEPALQRFSEQLTSEIRLEVARSLREMVQAAVAQELSKHRKSNP